MYKFKDHQKVSLLDLEYFQNIPSVKYRDEISLFCRQLENINNIKYLCMCIIFDDGSRFYLSNMPFWSAHYYSLGGKRGDKVFDLETYIQKDYYFPRLDEYDQIQRILVNVEEEVYGHYDTFSICRPSKYCKVIFLCGHNYPVQDLSRMYLSSLKKFEIFCNYFLEKFYYVVVENHPEKKHIPLISDLYYRKNIICSESRIRCVNLTPRETQLLHLLREDASTQMISESMGIKIKTVRNMIYILTEKYNVGSRKDLVGKASVVGDIV